MVIKNVPGQVLKGKFSRVVVSVCGFVGVSVCGEGALTCTNLCTAHPSDVAQVSQRNSCRATDTSLINQIRFLSRHVSHVVSDEGVPTQVFPAASPQAWC